MLTEGYIIIIIIIAYGRWRWLLHISESSQLSCLVLSLDNNLMELIMRL